VLFGNAGGFFASSMNFLELVTLHRPRPTAVARKLDS